MSPILRDSAKADANASRRLILILALFLFIIALSLIIIQSIGGSPKLVSSYENGYADGFNKARAMAERRMPILTQGVRILSGRIVSIGEQTLVVEADNLYVDQMVDGIGTMKTVRIGSDTKIVQLKQLSVEEIQKAQQDFQAKMKAYNQNSATTPPLPSASSKEVPLTFKDLKVGDQVTVAPSGDVEDVGTLDSFAAAKINITR